VAARGDINDIDVIYFTHVHPDHCSGLTALLNYWKSFSRQKPLVIYSQPQQRPVLMQLAALANWPQTTCVSISTGATPPTHGRGTTGISAPPKPGMS
jgi:ribonuclease BN (tRNA processing enzyme)